MALCACALVAAGLAGCGDAKNASSTTGSTGASSTGAPQATFLLTEWKIVLEGTIPAGPVNVKVDNPGGEPHELVIVAAKDAASLPKRPDGSVDEDKIPAQDKVGDSGDIAAGTSVTKTFTFAPGTYVAICNLVDDMGMSGSTMMSDGHGGSGMGDDHGSMPGSSNGSMPADSHGSMPAGAGSNAGHVHFAQGMAMTFTVT